MERQEALEKLQAAFPKDECEISLIHDRIWFDVRGEDLRVGVPRDSYDEVGDAIAVLRLMR